MSLVVFPNNENTLHKNENSESIAESETWYINCHDSKNIIINLAQGVKTVGECEGSSCLASMLVHSSSESYNYR